MTTTLFAPWHTVREVTTPSVLNIPAGVRAVLRTKCGGEFHQVCVGPTTVDTHFDAFLPLSKSGVDGPLVERTPVVTCEWTEKPPNDETCIAVLTAHSAVESRYGCDNQIVRQLSVAWMLVTEWQQFLLDPRAIHVPVTAEMMFKARNPNVDWIAWSTRHSSMIPVIEAEARRVTAALASGVAP